MRSLVVVSVALGVVACAEAPAGPRDGSANDASNETGGEAGRDSSDGAVPSSSVTCGPQLQCGRTQACCVSLQGMAVQYSCVSTDCPVTQTALQCARESDCPTGNVCCLHLDTNDNQVSSACMSACPDVPGEAQLCDPAMATTSCPPNDPCSSDNIGDWNLPPSFGTCGGKTN